MIVIASGVISEAAQAPAQKPSFEVATEKQTNRGSMISQPAVMAIALLPLGAQVSSPQAGGVYSRPA
jgi:hypothetical protein